MAAAQYHPHAAVVQAIPTLPRSVRFIAALAAGFVFSILGPLPNADAAGLSKHVLVLNSTRPDEQFSEITEREVPRLLHEGLGEHMDYFTEYFDYLRFPQPRYRRTYLDFLRQKYEGRQFDLLIVMGSVAIDFMSRYRGVLFPGTPVVFYSIHPPSSRMSNSTGLINELDFSGSISLARALQPDLKHVYVVSGAAASDRAFEQRTRLDFRAFEPRIDFRYLSGLTTWELEHRLRTLPPHSAVYFAVASQDGAGEHFQQMAYLSRVAAAANAPTYSWADAAVDSGIVGGRRRDHLAETRAIATLALRVLHGETADAIPVSSLNTDVDQVDWRQLRRWGLDESRLPRRTRVLFRQPSPWDRYQRYVVGALALILAQTVLIAGLLVQRSKRRRAELELRGSQSQLRASYDRIRHLGRRLLGAQEAERARVARELHDDISQQLAILSIELDALQAHLPIDSAKRLSRTLARAQDISRNVHELSHQLHPSKLQLMGLVAAIDGLQRDVSQAHLFISFSHRDVPGQLDQETALCLFRVAQEALGNVVKHSGAGHVWMDLAGGPTGVTLMITDDGRGFDVEAAAGVGLGLSNISERVESIGGTLEIDSTHGAGTRLKVVVPVHSAVPDPPPEQIAAEELVS
jgi:signal transduction histidine kinase